MPSHWPTTPILSPSPLQVPQLNHFGPVQVYPRKRSASSSEQAQQQGDGSGRQLFVSNLGLAVSRDAVGKHFQQ